MKKIILTISVISIMFNIALAKDTKEIKIDSSELRVVIELVKLNQEIINKRFEDMQKHTDKRFEDMQKHTDKRFEDMQKHTDKRFEDMQKQMDKRFEQMDKRFEDMQKQMDKRFEQVDKRFEDMQKHTDKRFDTILNFLGAIVTLMIAGFGVVITYLVKDRALAMNNKKSLEMEVENIENRLKEKADKSVVEKIVEAIERLAKDDKEVQNILKRHNLSYNG